MTVQELINKLSQCPQNAQVVIHDDGDFIVVDEARLVGLVKTPNGLRYPIPVGPESRESHPEYVYLA